MVETMLTTKDNPFNPFDDFNSWYLYDIEKGYNTCSLLGRLTQTNDEGLSYQEENEFINNAIDDIIKYDARNIYTTVSQKSDVYDADA